MAQYVGTRADLGEDIAKAVFWTLIDRFSGTENEPGDPREIAKHRLVDLIDGAPLSLEVSKLKPESRTGSNLGDRAEVLSRQESDDLTTLVLLGDLVRTRLTGENPARPLFAGSLHGLLREIHIRKAPQIVFQLIDEKDRDASLRLARSEVQKAGEKKTPVTFRIICNDASLKEELLKLNSAATSHIKIEVYSRSQASSLSRALEHGAVSKDELKNQLFYFLAPKSMKQDLDAFLDYENISDIDFESNRERFRIFLMLTRTLNPLTVEFNREQLGHLDDLNKLILRILQQA
jgi:hypothetical protein